MTRQFPIVFEREASGIVSAHVAGLPVYAQGATQRQAETAIRRTLAAYLTAHPDGHSDVQIKVATWRGNVRQLHIVTAAALLGRRTTPRKAAAARLNGRLGGRPRADSRA